MANISADVAVIGAGVFGTWSALLLQEDRVNTLLIDAWGVAHPRATSADESRVTRSSYGEKTLYTDWAGQALQEWTKREREWSMTLFVPCGVLFMGKRDDPHLTSSLEALRRRHIPFRELSVKKLASEFPQFSTDGVEQIYLETASGALLARKACQRTAQAFQDRGGKFLLAEALPPKAETTRLDAVQLAGGDTVSAESFVFAAGPWLTRLFPDLLQAKIQVTKQDVFYFGVVPGQSEFFPPQMPVWIDFTEEERFYGLPPLENRGMKVASDLSGSAFDPTHDDRVVSAQELAKVRRYLGRRIPTMKSAPLVESRVCQYERSPDSNLIVDRHPVWKNVLIAGAGSSHGFKLGPAVGRLAADLVQGKLKQPPPPEVRLLR